ncbi:MAG: hypothetical protein MUF04_04185 [Akkermansiaceae bacterium]|nr:hypothetical protein [Akkermansiaceae bacterium]
MTSPVAGLVSVYSLPERAGVYLPLIQALAGAGAGDEDGVAQFALEFLFHWAQRQAHRAAGQAVEFAGVFHALDELAAAFEHGHHRQQRLHQAAAGGEILADRAGLIEREALGGKEIGGGADPRAGAPGEELKRLVVRPARELKVGELAGDEVDAVHIAAAFLDGGEIGVAGDAAEEFLTKLGARAAGVVVEHDRQAAGLVHGERVLREFLVGGHRIRRHRQQDGGGAGIAPGGGVGANILGADVVDAGEPRDAAVDELVSELKLADPFVAGKRVVFTRGATNHQSVNTLGDQVFDHDFVTGFVNAEVGVHRGDDRGVDSFKAHNQWGGAGRAREDAAAVAPDARANPLEC